MSQTIEELMKKPYSREIIPDPEGGFVGEVRELPGCLTQGETVEETWANLEEAMHLWLETELELGREIPEPFEERKYSGKLLLRLPRFLHRELAERAKEEESSLNMFLVALLARAMGRTKRLKAAEGPTQSDDILHGEPEFVTDDWEAEVVPFEKERRAG